MGIEDVVVRGDLVGFSVWSVCKYIFEVSFLNIVYIYIWFECSIVWGWWWIWEFVYCF